MNSMSKFFSDHELGCRDGCGKMPNPAIIHIADQIRGGWALLHPDQPGVNCLSGSRCNAYTLVLRQQGTPAALKSAHIDGDAIDLAPVNGKIKEFHDYVAGRLEELDIYMEHPDSTPSWCHIQTRKIPGGNRIFRP